MIMNRIMAAVERLRGRFDFGNRNKRKASREAAKRPPKRRRRR